MLVSILICTRNRASSLHDMLTALARTAQPLGLGIEVVVVDNGSTDSTREVVGRHHLFGREVVYLHEARGGKAVALNAGIDRSAGDLLVLTDDDVHPTQAWLAELTGPILTERCDAVSGSVAIAPHLRRDWMTPLHAAWLAATDYLDRNRPETAVGANMAFHRRVLKRVPRFDPDLGPGRLGLWEDTLFSLQLREAGYRLAMAEEARVEHHFDASRLERRAFLGRAQAEGRSSAYVAWHWRHESRLRSRRELAHWYFLLLAKRLTRWSQWRHPEGMPEWEINLVTGIAFERHFLKVKQQSRLYRRHGLEKLSSTAGS